MKNSKWINAAVLGLLSAGTIATHAASIGSVLPAKKEGCNGKDRCKDGCTGEKKEGAIL